MATASPTPPLTSPRVFILRMTVFLLLAGFLALILYRQIMVAFMAKPGLNGLILFVLATGIVIALRQVVRLFPEIRWVNAPEAGAPAKPPVLLAPVAAILGAGGNGRGISPATLRVVLDSIGSRLDESREIARYITGLLVFLGLLGTFWGLLETVGSIGAVIKSMQTGGDAAVMFDDLKNGLAAPIAGMSISFTSSLFGLAGSLIVGFLDLQAGQAQNRFFTELEDNLSMRVVDPAGVVAAIGGFPNATAAAPASAGDANRATTAAMANLAEGIQGLVQHMRKEQQMIRDWVEAQAGQQEAVKKLLERLASETEKN